MASRTRARAPIIVTHCGAGSTMAVVDGAEEAGHIGLTVLERGGPALDAVTDAIVALEDDPRMNAGTGSRLRIDGRAQMDASIMTDDLEAGAVAAIEYVKNPILVARKVMETPHILLVGSDAIRFARRMGFRKYDAVTPDSTRRWKESLEKIRAGDLSPHEKKWRAFRDLIGTVGAVARDTAGRFSAGSSTGGTAFMMPGRVGDSPIIGAGIYCGPEGAVSVTGHGEEIIRRVLSKFVYDRMAAGRTTQAACEDGLLLYKRSVPIGIIAVGMDGAGEACNRPMAWWTNAPGERSRRHRIA
ncbi:MAG: L-asparaginase [Methanobacteriota archaeon]|nr:MAG: L-asparaginase [Euryarchaeota archaeon]